LVHSVSSYSIDDHAFQQRERQQQHGGDGVRLRYGIGLQRCDGE